MWSWYTGAGLTVVERIDRVDHELQQAVPELGVTLASGVAAGRAPGVMVMMMVGPRLAALGAADTAASDDAADAAAGAAAAAAPAAAATGVTGHRYAAAAARARHAAHARLAAVGRVRMLLEHKPDTRPRMSDLRRCATTIALYTYSASLNYILTVP